MTSYFKRMINTIQASGTPEAYALAKRDKAKKVKARKVAKASRKRNRS